MKNFSEENEKFWVKIELSCKFLISEKGIPAGDHSNETLLSHFIQLLVKTGL